MKEFLICTIAFIILIHLIRNVIWGDVVLFEPNFHPMFFGLYIGLLFIFFKNGSIVFRYDSLLTSIILYPILYGIYFILDNTLFEYFRKKEINKFKEKEKYRKEHIVDFLNKEKLKELLELNKKQNIINENRLCNCSCPFLEKPYMCKEENVEMYSDKCNNMDIFFYDDMNCSVFNESLEFIETCKNYLDDGEKFNKCLLCQHKDNKELQEFINELKRTT